MSFENNLRALIGTPVSQSKYIYGSIFHLDFVTTEGEAELVCNGCQWAVFKDNEIRLHDEAVLSNSALSGLFTGQRLRFVEMTPSMLTLHFDDSVLRSFITKEYHLDIHDNVGLDTPEWRAISDASRHSFMLFLPRNEETGWEFSAYCDLENIPWGAKYLATQERADG